MCVLPGNRSAKWWSPAVYALICGALSLAICALICGVPRHASGAAARTATNPSPTEQGVTYVGANPLSICWSCYSPPRRKSGGGADGAAGTSRIVFWRGGHIWSRNRVYGWGWLQFLRRPSLLVWFTPRAIHTLPLIRASQGRRLTAPPRFIFANYANAIDRGRHLAAVALNGFGTHFPPKEQYKVELVDLDDGKASIKALDAFPYALAFRLGKLIVSTFRLSPSGPRGFLTETFSVTKAGQKFNLRLIARKRSVGLIASFAGNRPVLIGRGGHSVLIGSKRIGVGKGTERVQQVVGSSRALLVVGKSGKLGMMKSPNWRYRGIGSLRSGELIGTGRNSAGFWLAQPTARLGAVRITQVTLSGTVRTTLIEIPPASAR